MLEAVIGAVFMTSAAEHGIDGAIEDAWRLFSTLQRHPSRAAHARGAHTKHRGGMRANAVVHDDWNDALDVLRQRLVADRAGHLKVWVDRLQIPWPDEPRLVVAASLRAFEGQSLEFIGDGVLRLVQTLHLLQALPDAELGQKARVRMAMERNPFLARRLARVIGDDLTGLSFKLRSAQIEVLRDLGPPKRPARPDDGADIFEADLNARQGPKILADLLEALIGAVALHEEGLEGVVHTFSRIVLPPPAAIRHR